MTPQLQQAIRLLQPSSLELQSEIQEILESNPMLDNEESNENASDDDTNSNEESSKASSSEASDGDIDRSENMDIPNDLPVDSEWGDTFDTYTPAKPIDPDDNRTMEQAQNAGESLSEHLMWQMRLTPFSEVDMAIATSIIDSIDGSGFLTTTIEDLYQSLKEELEIELDEVESVLRRIQNFDPPGVGARDLQESMLLQLGYFDPETPWFKEAKTIIADHFDLLANRDYLLLMRRTKLNEKQLQSTMALIQSLNPRPGSQITDSQPEYVVPDVFVRKVKGRWRVELNPDVTPKLSVNALYANLAQKNSKASDTTYMENLL